MMHVIDIQYAGKWLTRLRRFSLSTMRVRGNRQLVRRHLNHSRTGVGSSLGDLKGRVMFKIIIIAATAALSIQAMAAPAHAAETDKIWMRCSPTSGFVNGTPIRGLQPFLVQIWPQARSIVYGNTPYRNVTITPDVISFDAPNGGGSVLIDRQSGFYYDRGPNITENGSCQVVTVTPVGNGLFTVAPVGNGS
jgi:hypothetical protein